MNSISELLADVEAEEAIVATAIAKPNGLAQLAGRVEPKHFYRSHHGLILEAAQAIWQRGETVNSITVAHELAVRGHLEQCGGATFLDDVVRRTPTTAGESPIWYASIVRRLAMSREALSAASAIQSLVRDNPDDVERAIDRGIQLLTGIASQVSTEDVVEAGQALADGLWAKINDHLEDPSANMGVPTGITDFDAAIGGIVKGRVYLYGAETSMGKSLFAQDIMRRLARRGVRCLVFTTEMGRDEVLWRMVFQEAGIDPQAHRKAGYTTGEKERIQNAMDVVAQWPLTICDRGDLSAAYLRGVVQRQKARHPDLFLVTVDHIDMVAGTGGNRTSELEGITKGLKAIARDAQVAVLEVSHVSRLNDYNRSSKSARLRNSESKAQDSDIAWMFTPVAQNVAGEWAPLDPDAARERMATGLHVALDVFKNRHGRTGSSRLFLSWSTGGRFENG